MFEYLVMFLALCAVGRIARRETVAVRYLRVGDGRHGYGADAMEPRS